MFYPKGAQTASPLFKPEEISGFEWIKVLILIPPVLIMNGYSAPGAYWAAATSWPGGG
jgi:hypothetical protein